MARTAAAEERTGGMTKPEFHALMVNTATGPRLSAMLADNARVDQQLVLAGRKDCCADFAFVIFCDNVTDTWECPFCGYTWTAPCR